jgi:hypothetical protein
MAEASSQTRAPRVTAHDAGLWVTTETLALPAGVMVAKPARRRARTAEVGLDAIRIVQLAPTHHHPTQLKLMECMHAPIALDTTSMAAAGAGEQAHGSHVSCESFSMLLLCNSGSVTLQFCEPQKSSRFGMVRGGHYPLPRA